MSDYFYFVLPCPYCKKKQQVIYVDDEYEDGRKKECVFCNKKFQVEMTFKVKKV